jgi:hypothetical protein
MFFNEIYKSSKQINGRKTSQSILFMCSEVWHESAEISEDPVYVCKAASKLHLGVSMQVVIHTKFAFPRLEQYGYCY